MNQFFLTQRAFSIALAIGLTAVMLASYQNCGQAEFSRIASEGTEKVTCQPTAQDANGDCVTDTQIASISSRVENGRGITIRPLGSLCEGLVDPADVTAGLHRIATIKLTANNFNPVEWQCTPISPTNGGLGTVQCNTLASLPGAAGSSCQFINTGVRTAELRCQGLPDSSGFPFYQLQVSALASINGGTQPTNIENATFTVGNCNITPPPPVNNNFTILGVLGTEDNAVDQFLAGATESPIVRVQRRDQFVRYNVRFEKRPEAQWFTSLGEEAGLAEAGDIDSACSVMGLVPFRTGPDWSDLRLGSYGGSTPPANCHLRLERVKVFVTGVKADGAEYSQQNPSVPNANTAPGLAVRVLNNIRPGTFNKVLVLGVYKPQGLDQSIDRLLSNENKNPVFRVFVPFDTNPILPALTSWNFRMTVRTAAGQALCTPDISQVTNTQQGQYFDIMTANCPTGAAVFALTNPANSADDYNVTISASAMRGATPAFFTDGTLSFDVVGPVDDGFSLLGIAAAPGEPFARTSLSGPPKIRRTRTPVIESEDPDLAINGQLFSVVISKYKPDTTWENVCNASNVLGTTLTGTSNLALALQCPTVLTEGTYKADVRVLDSGAGRPADSSLQFVIDRDSYPDGNLYRIAGIQGADDLNPDAFFVGSGLPWVRVQAVNPNDPLNYLPLKFWLTIKNNDATRSNFCDRTLLSPQSVLTASDPLTDIQALVKTAACKEALQGSPVGKKFYAVVEAANLDGTLAEEIQISPYLFTWQGNDLSTYSVSWASVDPVRVKAPNQGGTPLEVISALKLNKPAPPGGIIVSVVIGIESAVHNEDFRAEGGSGVSLLKKVLFAEGTDTAEYPIMVLPDPKGEIYNFQPGVSPPAETTRMNLVSGGTPGVQIPPAGASKQLQIAPSDENLWVPPGFHFLPANDITVTEGTQQNFQICPDQPLTEDFIVRIQSRPLGTPTPKGPVAAATSLDYTFPGSQPTGTQIHTTEVRLYSDPTFKRCSVVFAVSFLADGITENSEVFGLVANQVQRVATGMNYAVDIPYWGTIVDSVPGSTGKILGIVGNGDDVADHFLTATDSRPIVKVEHSEAYYSVEIKTSNSMSAPALCVSYPQLPIEPIAVSLDPGCAPLTARDQIYYAFVSNGAGSCKVAGNCKPMSNSPYSFELSSKPSAAMRILFSEGASGSISSALRSLSTQLPEANTAGSSFTIHAQSAAAGSGRFLVDLAFRPGAAPSASSNDLSLSTATVSVPFNGSATFKITPTMDGLPEGSGTENAVIYVTGMRPDPASPPNTQFEYVYDFGTPNAADEAKIRLAILDDAAAYSNVKVFVTDNPYRFIENSSGTFPTWVTGTVPYPVELTYRLTGAGYGTDFVIDGRGTYADGTPIPNPTSLGNGLYKVPFSTDSFTYRGMITHLSNTIPEPYTTATLELISAEYITPTGRFPLQIDQSRKTCIIELIDDDSNPAID